MFQAVVAPEALLDFFQRMQTFFQRLKGYTEVSLNDKVKDRIVGFMAEVLTTLAILTKHIKQRRLSEFILGDTSYLNSSSLFSKLYEDYYSPSRSAAVELIR